MKRAVAGYLLDEPPLQRAGAIAFHRGTREAEGLPVLVETPDHGASSNVHARLRRAFAILSDLSLPGVLRPIELVDKPPALLLVTEDRGLPTLALELARGPMDPALSVRFALSIAVTLDELHQRGIVHGDLRPSSIYVDPERGAAFLTSFGFSVRTGKRGAEVREASPVGSLVYAAPERTGRTSRGFDGRADLYSLGAVLYEMLTGSPPFSSIDPLELAHAHLARIPVPALSRAPNVPPMLSAIAEKLLAKAPTARYRSGRGLAYDLELSLRGEGDPLALGTRDAPDEKKIRDKPLGREAEAEALAQAAARVSAGAVELLFVVGPAGSGKSTLVEHAREAVVQSGGHFASAKCSAKDAPYAPLAQVMGELGRRILAEPEERLAALRERLSKALGPNAKLLAELAAPLGLMFGHLPPVPELGPSQSRTRFELVVRQFLRALVFDRPLILLFFDDLAEADPATLSVLGRVLADSESSRLLLVGSAHEEDMIRGKPLDRFAADLGKKGLTISRILLGPLGRREVTKIVADALGAEPQEVSALGRIVHEKTRGNPFFVLQMLEALSAEGLVGRDPETFSLRWDERKIREAPIPNDAAELVATRLQKGSAEAKEALGAAACLGLHFDAKAVAKVLGSSEVEISAALAEAAAQGMIAPLEDGSGAYVFVHEKVREAARALLGEGERKKVYLAAASAIAAERGDSDERLFEAAAFFADAADGIEGLDKRREVAALLGIAARKARARSAFQAAARFYAAQAALSEEEPDTSLWWIERAECEYLSGNADVAEAFFGKATGLAETPLETSRVSGQKLLFRTAQGRYAEAIEAGLVGLAGLGVALPERGFLLSSLPSRMAEIEGLLRGRSPRDLASAPPIADPLELAKLELLVALVAPTYIADQPLYLVVMTLIVALCVEHGYAEVASYAYASYAVMRAMSLGEEVLSRQFFQLGVELEARVESGLMRGKTAWTIAACAPHFIPLRATLPIIARALSYSLASGDASYVSFALHLDVTTRLWSGEPLPAVREALERAMVTLPSAREPTASATLAVAGRFMLALAGKTRRTTSFDGDDFNDEAFVEEIEGAHPYAACAHHVSLAKLHFLFGDLEGALEWVERAEAVSSAAMWLHLETVVVFVGALVRAALLPGVRDRAAKAALRDKLDGNAKSLAFLAKLCPENYLHAHLLISAEIASLDGKYGAARELYDEASDAARQYGFLHHEGLANELAAKALFVRGKNDIARPYLEAAMRAYSSWGASAKVEQLRARFPDVFGGVVGPHSRAAGAPSRGARSLDAVAIVRAAEAIAGEIDLDKLLERLLHTVLEVAGADSGALVLGREGELLVAATMSVEGAEIGEMRPLAAAQNVAAAVVQYVARTRQPVVVGRGATGTPFEADPRLVLATPRSFLGLPLVHREGLTGVLYLENRHVEEAFSEGRAELLAMLSSQAAIAIENAVLVADVRKRTEELARANEGLREELSRREVAEAERAALEQEIIDMQRRRLAELSAPLVPITSRVMVIPIVGTVDAPRADELMRVALDGASQKSLKALILDITGVSVVDSHVAGRLLDMVRALQLLGTEAVVTGIRGEVARALVALDIDFGSKVVTKSTLQAGIAYALGR